MLLDLESLESVRRFAKEVLRDFPKINVLINNAGLSVPVCQQRKTKDGYEIHFGVNHLGHFLLTNLLLPRLKDSSPSR
jgi:NAD(P)-dependent dehydrogenase (short-subunit alcohol dehydrogenase family)